MTDEPVSFSELDDGELFERKIGDRPVWRFRKDEFAGLNGHGFENAVWMEPGKEETPTFMQKEAECFRVLEESE